MGLMLMYGVWMTLPSIKLNIGYNELQNHSPPPHPHLLDRFYYNDRAVKEHKLQW
jgi:hypothetical protein